MTTANTATEAPSETPVTPSFNLACTYCGGALSINCEYEGPAYMAENVPVSIECSNYACEAEWTTQGVLTEEPRWIKYPTLYTKP